MEERYSKLGQEISDPKSILYVEGLLVSPRAELFSPTRHLPASLPVGRHGRSRLGLRLAVSEAEQEH